MISLSRFVRKVHDALPEIMTAIDDTNGTTLSGLAHWIKGTGGTVGLPGLTDIGSELHAMAKAEDYSSARILVLELQAIVSRLQRDAQCEPAIDSSTDCSNHRNCRPPSVPGRLACSAIFGAGRAQCMEGLLTQHRDHFAMRLPPGSFRGE